MNHSYRPGRTGLRCLAALLAVMGFASCGPDVQPSGPDPDPEPPQEASAQCYVTTADFSRQFQQTAVEVVDRIPTGASEVVIDESSEHQSVDGFGAAMTWASCYNLMQMSAADRQEIMEELFSRERGLGISLVRVSIGASDFNTSNYTWCDERGMENFAVHPSDRDYVFPVLRQMVSINPDVKIIASPWSAPKWMKRVSSSDNSPYDSWTGGSLNNDRLPDYADYFVRWIRAMESEGLPIYAVTLQNEPLNCGNSISMQMTWNQQVKFIKEAVGPAFEREGIRSKILVFDHNFDYDGQTWQADYPIHVYDDAAARRYVSGSAWHNYSGDPSALDKVNAAYPDMEVYFTEATIGDWNYQDPGTRMLSDYRQVFMQMLRRGCRGVTLWNMVLDSARGPFNPAAGSCKTSYGVVNIDKSTRKVISRTSHYYNIAHTSKAILPGAVRVDALSSEFSDESIQAYRNPDGTHALIVLNDSPRPMSVAVRVADGFLPCTAPSRSLLTMTW